MQWRIALTATALLLTGEGYAAGQLGRHGESFAHGPYVRIAEQIRALGPEGVIVIEDGPEVDMCAGVYYPVRYLFGDRVRQYIVKLASTEPGFPVAMSSAEVRLRDFQMVRPQDPSFDLALLPASEWAMTIRSRNVSASELKQLLNAPIDGATLLGEGPAATALVNDPRWERVETRSYLSLVAARVDLFHRRASPY